MPSCNRVASALVPAAQTPPPAFEYIARSTTIRAGRPPIFSKLGVTRRNRGRPPRPILAYSKLVQELDMGKRLRVPISTARATLFQLTDLVRTSGDDTVVVLEQRGGPEQVVLVREARLAYLEARVTEIEKRDEQPFRLAGSLTSDVDDGILERVLRDIRTECSDKHLVS